MTRTAAKSAQERAAAEPAASYDRDYFAWTQEQARLLRETRFSAIDFENIAEELDDLGRGAKREIRNRTIVLLLHLLKWRYQPAKRTVSWRATIAIQRKELQRDLRESPSLRSYPRTMLDEIHEIARLKASGETKLLLETFPEACPFTIEQILDPDFLPDAGAT